MVLLYNEFSGLLEIRKYLIINDIFREEAELSRTIL